MSDTTTIICELCGRELSELGEPHKRKGRRNQVCEWLPPMAGLWNERDGLDWSDQLDGSAEAQRVHQAVTLRALRPGKSYGIIGKLRPYSITRDMAEDFVNAVHRTHEGMRVWKFGAGIADDVSLLGVAVVALPARLLMDGATLEVSRVAVMEDVPNGVTMLLAACARSAKAMGYKRLVTYTAPDQAGGSMRAAGWRDDGVHGNGQGHNRPSRKRRPTKHTGPRRRWWLEL